eukprot:11940489-Ditylum_brightwellii.AAC.1
MENQMDLWDKVLVEDAIKVNKHQQPTGQCNEDSDVYSKQNAGFCLSRQCNGSVMAGLAAK